MRTRSVTYRAPLIAILAMAMMGCTQGQQSSGAGGGSSLTWEFEDSCNDGQTVEIRFFDETDHTQWPSDPTKAYYLNYGDDQTYKLDCTQGADICYGASSGGGYWGVGENNDQPCSSGSSGCCYTCNGASIPASSFRCPSGATREAPANPNFRQLERQPEPHSNLMLFGAPNHVAVRTRRCLQRGREEQALAGLLERGDSRPWVGLWLLFQAGSTRKLGY